MWIVEVLGDSDVVVHRYYLKVIDGSTYEPTLIIRLVQSLIKY